MFVNITITVFMHNDIVAKSGDFNVFFNQFTSDFTLQ